MYVNKYIQKSVYDSNFSRQQRSFCNYTGVNASKFKGFLMLENLNGYFSSVFNRDDISSLPVPDAKFQETKYDYLGQLIVTTEIIGKKI